jgi:hypothetical protein
MKLSDESIIQSLTATQKPKLKGSKKPEVTLNKIIDVLKSSGGKCSRMELQEKLKNDNLSDTLFLERLRASKKISYDPLTEIFELKSEHNIKNIEELKQKIRTSEHGLREDGELIDSYPGIRNDIKRLKEEKFVRVVENADTAKNCNVLFYRDINDPTEKLIADPRYDEAIKELRKIWKDELNISASDNKQVIHSLNKRLRDDDDDDDNAKMKKAKKIKRNK